MKSVLVAGAYEYQTNCDRTWLSISPDTAAYAGRSFEQLKLFVSGSYFPTGEQLAALAGYLNHIEKISTGHSCFGSAERRPNIGLA